MTEPTTTHCFFCGAHFDESDVIRGAAGAICPACVYALGARLAETERSDSAVGDATKTINLTVLDDDGDMPGCQDDRSAHDYQSRIDLAAAYREMGRTSAAVNELLAAIESALLCADYRSALRCVVQAREVSDSPSVRDRICEIMTRHAPKTEETP